MVNKLVNKLLLSICLLSAMTAAQAQTNVTSRYVDNPDFESRFAGWHNDGFYYVTNKHFTKVKGNIFMERWVNAGSRIPNCDINQELVGLQAGTYMLTASCQNIQESDQGKVCTGATLYAGDEKTTVTKADDYNLVFTVVRGKAKIGFSVKSSTGNWACFDNIRLTYLGENKDSLALEVQKLITSAEKALGEGNGADELAAAIAAGKTMIENADYSDVETVARNLYNKTLMFNLLNGTGDVPVVTTNPFVATGATIALVRTTGGSSIKEQGVCWSTHPNPTVEDECSTDYFTNNGKIFRIEHLKPATVYYVRGYAITRKNQVGYGEVVKIATLPKGNVTGTYNNGGGAEENYRIASALNEIKWLYNNLTSIKDFNLTVNYGSETPTADCSYGGWMRVGPNDAYQQTGTMLHETNHGVGVGTSGPWWSGTYREEGDRGRWLGPRATQMIRFLQNDDTAFMTGDNTHMWPISAVACPTFGINGSWEDAYNPENTFLYYGNALITHAMHQDGLECTSALGFASPAYVFTQDDETVYYIKCEDEKEGLQGRYLSVNSQGQLVNALASIDEAKSDDSFGWQIKFNPASACYQFRNVGTGHYLSLVDNNMTMSTSLSSNSNIQLLPSRNNIDISGTVMTPYWIVKSRRSLQTENGKVSTTGWKEGNDATTQRWLLLTADEAKTVDDKYIGRYQSELTALISKMRQTMATPHVSRFEDVDVADVDQQYSDYITRIRDEKSSYTIAQIQEVLEEMPKKIMEFISQLNPASPAHPFDITWWIKNPNFDESNEGWSQKPTWNYQIVEFYESNFRFYQTLNELPAATYMAKAQAFQRPGTNEDTYSQYIAGNGEIKAYLQLGDGDKTYIKNIWDDATSDKKEGTCYSKNGLFIPASMHSAHSYFEDGLYDNSALVTTTEPGTLRLNFMTTKKDSYYWTCVDNFRLYYYGTWSEEEVVAGIEPKTIDTIDGNIYDLQGRRLNAVPEKGLYIINNKVYVR